MKNNLDKIFSKHLEDKKTPFQESSWDKMVDILDTQKGSSVSDTGPKPQSSHQSDSDRKWIFLFLFFCLPILSVSLLRKDGKHNSSMLYEASSVGYTSPKVLSNHAEKNSKDTDVNDPPIDSNSENHLHGNTNLSKKVDPVERVDSDMQSMGQVKDIETSDQPLNSDRNNMGINFSEELETYLPVRVKVRDDDIPPPIAGLIEVININRLSYGLLSGDREIETKQGVTPVEERNSAGIAFLSVVFNEKELGAGLGINLMRFSDFQLSLGVQHMWRRNDPVLLAQKEIIDYGVVSTSSRNISYTVKDEHFISVPLYVSYKLSKMRFLVGIEADYLLALKTELKEEGENGTSLRSVWIDERSYRHIAFKLAGGLGSNLGKGLNADALVRIPLKSRYQLQEEIDFDTGELSNNVLYTLRLTYDIFK